MTRKGVVLAGGRGSRLYPLTKVQSKQLLPVFDKPLIYYPLTTLMLAGIQEILIITTPEHQPRFEDLLGNGHQWGLEITYQVQHEPRGIADALLVARDFLTDSPSALVLGDNVFYGHGLTEMLQRANHLISGATLFGYMVKDPERYGVVVVDEDERPVQLVEKPDKWISPWAVTGLYFYDERAPELAASLVPSDRGELEITDLNKAYLEEGSLHVELMYRGFAWLDTGTHSSLYQAAAFVQTIQERQGIRIASPEEVAFRMGFINAADLMELAVQAPHSDYEEYLRNVALE